MAREPDSAPNLRSRGRRVLRRIALVLAGLIVVAILATATTIAVPSLRARVLLAGLHRATGGLPGEVTFTRVAWPRPEQLAFEGVTWADGPDTLAHVERFEIEIALRPLRRREYKIRSVFGAGIRADVPAIQARLEPVDGPVAADTSSVNPSFDLDLLPHVVIEDLRLENLRVRATPEVGIVAPALALRVDLRDADRRTLSLNGQVLAAEGLGVSTRLEATLDDSLVVRIAPLHVAESAHLPDPSTLPLDGVIATTLAALQTLGLDDRWPRLRAKGVAVTGVLGDLEIDTDLHGRDPGHLRARLAPAPPPPWLADRILAGLADTLAAGLRPLLAERWPHQAPPMLAVDATFAPPVAGDGIRPQETDATGSFVLPGPRDLRALLPDRLRVEDLGALRGRFSIRYAGADDSNHVHLALDLEETEWLKTGHVLLDTDARTWLDVDSLAIDLTGLALRARGRLTRNLVDARIEIDAASPVLERWDDPALEDIHGRLQATVTGVGRPERPRVRAEIDAAGEARGLSLPGITGRANLDGDHLVLAIAAPGGARYGETTLEPLDLSADLRRHDGAQRFVGTMSLAGGGRHGELDLPRVDLQAALGDRSLTMDAVFPSGLSYGVTVLDSAQVNFDMTAQLEPFWPRESRLRVTAAGRHDQIQLPGLRLDAALSDSTGTLNLTLPRGLISGQTRLDSLRCEFNGGVRDSLRQVFGRLDFRGAAAGSRTAFGADVDIGLKEGAPSLHALVDSFELHLRERGVMLQQPCRLAWDPRSGQLQVEGLDLRGRLGFMRGDLAISSEQVAGDLAWNLGTPLRPVHDLLPGHLLFAAAADTLVLNGRVRLAGPARDPAAHLETALALREPNGTTALVVQAATWLRNPVSSPGADWPAAPDDAPALGASVRASVRRGGTTLLDANGRLPWRFSLFPAAVLPDTTKPATVVARTTGLDLAALDGLLPPGNRVQGRLNLDATVTGTPGAWLVDGQAEGSRLLVSFSDGSWCGAEGALGLHGDSESIDVTGEVKVGSGLLRVPEAPPPLLPVSGELMLAPARVDTAVLAVADTIRTKPRRRLPLPDAAVRVLIPGNLWLRGRGLNVEIAGDLTVGTREGRSLVQGDLRAVQGSLKLLGHFFTLKSGRVVFVGDAQALDPDLDIRMTTRIGNTVYSVNVLGSVQAPQLELSSEPQMSEQDIVATLLFGRSLDQLQEGQASMVASRAAEVLAAYGSVQLQDWASQELGLDLLSIEPSSKGQDATSITVGQYLNPRTVVRYEKVMDTDSAWYVYLDYLLTSLLKVHTEIYDGGSGVELMLYYER